MGLGIVDGRDKVGHGGGLDAAFDDFPGGHEVGEGDDAEIVADGGSEQGGCFLEGGDASQRDHLNIARPFSLHLVDERCHAVDAGIARRDDHDGLAFFCQAECLFGTFALMLHARVDALTSWFQIRRDELEVVFVAHHHICLTYNFDNCGCDVFGAAWPDASHDNLSHTRAKLVLFCE